MKKIIFTLIFAGLISLCFGQNQRIRELQTQSTNNNNYYIAVDAGGWTRARKMTMQVATSLERALRSTADSLTRAGAGLNTTNGTYVVLTTSNYLTAADFAAIGLGGNINNAIFILDSILHDFLGGISCYSVCIDTFYCSGGSIYFGCNLTTDSTITGNNVVIPGSTSNSALTITDPDTNGIFISSNTDAQGNPFVGYDESPQSLMALYEDSSGHAIEIVGVNTFNPDSAISIDYSNSNQANTGIFFNGGLGAEIVFNSIGGSGNDIGFKFTGGSGTDIGLQISADVAADLTGNVTITTGKLVQEDETKTAATDTCPDVSSANIIFMNYGGSINLEGFKNGSTGQVIYVANKQTGNNVVIKEAAAVVSPAAHIHTGTGGDVTITNEGGATFVFDGTTWYMIGVEQ